MGVNLQKSDCYGLDSERKKVLTSSPGPLACAYIHLGVFGSVGTHLPSVKSILPYFSSPRGVAISVSFPEARIRKETVSGLSEGGEEDIRLVWRVSWLLEDAGCPLGNQVNHCRLPCNTCFVSIISHD